MFRLLVLDKRDSIQSAIKYLLHRYDLVFCYDARDAATKLESNSIDMFLFNFSSDEESSAENDIVKEWIQKKKTIVVADTITPELIDEVKKMGAVTCIDKLDIGRLPEIVGRHLNQSVTRIMDFNN